MKRTGDSLEFSATDLAGYLNCRHLSALERASADGSLSGPVVRDLFFDTLRERGLFARTKLCRATGGGGRRDRQDRERGGRQAAKGNEGAFLRLCLCSELAAAAPERIAFPVRAAAVPRRGRLFPHGEARHARSRDGAEDRFQSQELRSRRRRATRTCALGNGISVQSEARERRDLAGQARTISSPRLFEAERPDGFSLPTPVAAFSKWRSAVRAGG